MRGDACHAPRHAPGELGLHFTRDGDRWRCVERPALVMLPGDRYEVRGRSYDLLTDAARMGFDAPVFDGPYEIRMDGPRGG